MAKLFSYVPGRYTTDLKVDGNREVRPGLRLVIPALINRPKIMRIKLFEAALRRSVYPGHCGSSAIIAGNTGLFKTFTPRREKERKILGPNR